MHYHIITIFPEIFDSFLATSLISKAQEQGLLQFSFINPRDFCADPQRQIDDAMYGGGAGMLMKAQPIIDAIKSIIASQNMTTETGDLRKRKVLLPRPSQQSFTQTTAHILAEEATDIILICGRYEGIDHRVDLRCQQLFGEDFMPISLGQYVVMGGEAPSMLIIEAISRLVPGVIKESDSRKTKAIAPSSVVKMLNAPNTLDQNRLKVGVYQMSCWGNHALIEQWRKENGEQRIEK